MQNPWGYLSSGSGVNLAVLHDFIRKDLLECIERASEPRVPKALVIDKALVGLLGLVAKHSDLKVMNENEKWKKESKWNQPSG